MQNSLTLHDPIAFAKAEAERQIGQSLDIAHEIYLVRQCATLHYADLMNEVPSGTASKDILLAWIRDYQSRSGVIALYIQARPNHFDNGAWMARHFAQFIEFAKDKLTDKGFVGSLKKAQLFSTSFEDEVWRRKAAAVLGLKLLEEMYKRRKLRSREAERILFTNFQSRELLQSMAYAVGRIAKNQGLLAASGSDVSDAINDHFKRQWAYWKQHPVSDSEMKCFDQFELAIERTMTTLFRSNLQLGSAAVSVH
jgi:hypothetical protein